MGAGCDGPAVILYACTISAQYCLVIQMKWFTMLFELARITDILRGLNGKYLQNWYFCNQQKLHFYTLFFFRVEYL